MEINTAAAEKPKITVKVEGLSYSYRDDEPVLKNISFAAMEGESLGIIGLNGSGKTTLCYALCGLIPHYYGGKMTGRVYINGKSTWEIPLNQIASEVGVILQDPNEQILMPTVEEEIVFSLENNLFPRNEIRKRLNLVLDSLGIRALKDFSPYRLSGGEKQLVVLAASLVLEPSVLILDESLSMLDEQSSQKIIGVLQELKKRKKTFIIVDHTLQSAPILDRVIVLEKGRAVFCGRRDDLPADWYESGVNNDE